MRCLQCNEELGGLACLRHDEFCCEEHRVRYYDEQVRELVERVAGNRLASPSRTGPGGDDGVAAPPLIFAELSEPSGGMDGLLPPPPDASCFCEPVRAFETFQFSLREPLPAAGWRPTCLLWDRIGLPKLAPGPGKHRTPPAEPRPALDPRIRGAVQRAATASRARAAVELPLPAVLLRAGLAGRSPAEIWSRRSHPLSRPAVVPQVTARTSRPAISSSFRCRPLGRAARPEVAFPGPAPRTAPPAPEPRRSAVRLWSPPGRLAPRTPRVSTIHPTGLRGTAWFLRPPSEPPVPDAPELPRPGTAFPVRLTRKGTRSCHDMLRKMAPWLRPGMRIRGRVALGRLSAPSCPTLHWDSARLAALPGRMSTGALALEPKPGPLRVLAPASGPEPCRAELHPASHRPCWNLLRIPDSRCTVNAALRLRMAVPEGGRGPRRQRPGVEHGEKRGRNTEVISCFRRFT